MGLFGSMGRRKGLMGSGIVEGDNPAQDDWMRRLFDTQGQDQTMQRESGMGSPGGIDFNGIADGFGRAGAYFDGDWGAASEMGARQAQTRASIAQQAAKQAELARATKAYEAQGLTPDQAYLSATGSANIGDFRQKAPDQPAFVRDFKAWSELDDETKQGILGMKNSLDPIAVDGADGRYIAPRVLTRQQGYNPSEWEDVNDPQANGGAGPATPRPFRRYR